jgi:hypothetical protein
LSFTRAARRLSAELALVCAWTPLWAWWTFTSTVQQSLQKDSFVNLKNSLAILVHHVVAKDHNALRRIGCLLFGEHFYLSMDGISWSYRGEETTSLDAK